MFTNKWPLAASRKIHSWFNRMYVLFCVCIGVLGEISRVESKIWSVTAFEKQKITIPLNLLPLANVDLFSFWNFWFLFTNFPCRPQANWCFYIYPRFSFITANPLWPMLLLETHSTQHVNVRVTYIVRTSRFCNECRYVL